MIAPEQKPDTAQEVVSLESLSLHRVGCSADDTTAASESSKQDGGSLATAHLSGNGDLEMLLQRR